MMEHPNLKIIADDLGLYESVNDGIVFLLKEKKISGASLMANGEAFEDAVKKCLEAQLPNIGIHLNLVEQKSVVSGEPMLKNHRIFFLKYVLGLVKKEYIWQELEAQIKKCIQAGIKPAFINGNQHLHLLPGIMDICIKLAIEYDIPYIRTVNEPVNLSGGKFFRKLQLLFLNFLSVAAREKIHKAGLRCNNYFIGFIGAGNMSDRDIKYAEDLAQKYPDKIVELGCHPGHENEGLKRKYKHWGNYNWQKEFELLTNDQINKILYISQTRLDYSLNAVLIKGLRENNVQVSDIQIKKGVSGLVKALSFYKRNSKDADLVMVGYNSQLLAFFLRPFCRRKIIYNAILSEYERMVISRQLAHKFSLKGVYYWLLDLLATHSADLILLESNEQGNFFNKVFKVSKKKLYRNWIGCDEGKFYYDLSVPKRDVFTVLFRGALMPEAGAEYIIKVAKILENENINFILIGGGLLLEKTEKLIKDANLKNIKHITDRLPYDALRTMMQSCHISLGQLSHHVRLKRTLPHKVYETLSMRLPYLTSANTGILELLTPDETCILCGPADEQSLADKILWAKDNPQELERIAENGHRLYQEKLRSVILAKHLLVRIKNL